MQKKAKEKATIRYCELHGLAHERLSVKPSEEDIKKAMNDSASVCWTTLCSTDTLTITPSATVSGWEVVTPYVSAKETKPRSIPMFYSDDYDTGAVNIEATQRNHLLSRLQTARWEKKADAEERYHIHDDEPPATPQEAIDRIKEGKFKIKKGKFTDSGEEYFPYGAWEYIKWRSEDKDEKGFEEFTERLHTAANAVQDIIVVKPLDDGLKALEDFRATTIH